MGKKREPGKGKGGQGGPETSWETLSAMALSRRADTRKPGALLRDWGRCCQDLVLRAVH